MRSARHLVAAVAFAAVVALPSAGMARDSCRGGCFRQTRHCVADQARAALFACKVECASGSLLDLPSCIQGCGTTFRADRATCHEQHAICATLCDDSQNDPAYDPACVGACGSGLATCGQGVAVEGRRCMVGCFDFPGQLGIECLYGCAEAAKTDALACGADFRGCMQSCATATTTLP